MRCRWVEADLDFWRNFSALQNVVICRRGSCRTWRTQWDFTPWCRSMCRWKARLITWNKWCVLMICLCEENCRGGTEVSVRITCDVEYKRMFGKALMWPLWTRRLISKEKNKRDSEKEENKREKGGVMKVGDAITWSSRDNALAMGRCTLRQPANVFCIVMFPSTFFATSLDTYTELEVDCTTRNNKLVISRHMTFIRHRK